MDCSNLTTLTSHCQTIQHILIIEDSSALAKHLQDNIEEAFSFPCDVAHSETEAKEKISRKDYDLIITDLYLPDSTSRFISDLIKAKLRVIVITGNENSEKRSEILTYPIVDYILKTDAKTLVRYLIKTIERLNKNRHTVVAICDDSKFSRQLVINQLIPQNLGYAEFSNGEEAYRCITDKKMKIDILLTDYEMPIMNGLELVRHLRHTFYPDELPIISISASDKVNLLVQFLKAGASDYVQKPLISEEFLVRLNITLDQLYTTRENNEMLKQLRQASSHDYLTQLYNRKHYFSLINHITAEAIRHNRPYGILMIDIDHFKKVNDTYGHHAGDMAIQHIAMLLKQTARASDYCFRWGGEEFLILVPSTTHTELYNFAERLRQIIQMTNVYIEDLNLNIQITISIGGDIGLCDTSELMISKADTMLYKAKKAGRNCTRISD